MQVAGIAPAPGGERRRLQSGQIEAEADVIALLHRDDLHHPDPPRAGEIDVIVAKQRNGPTGTVALGFQGHYGRLCDLAGWAN